MIDQTSREAFDALVRHLHEAYGVKPMQTRLDAYWVSLRKANMPDLERAIEHCLGEEGPERLPTHRQVWSLLKQLRPIRARGALDTPKRDVLSDLDEWDIHARGVLFDHIRRTAGSHGRAADGSVRCLYGSSRYNPVSRTLEPDRRMLGNVEQLRQIAEVFALELREVPESRVPTTQRAIWDDLIDGLERRIAGTAALELT